MSATYKITNCATDPRFAVKRAKAQKMEMEPLIAGVRVRLGQSITINQEQWENNFDRIKLGEEHGVLLVESEGQSKPAPKPKKKEAAPPPPPKEESKEEPPGVPDESPATEDAPPPPPAPEEETSEAETSKKSSKSGKTGRRRGKK